MRQLSVIFKKKQHDIDIDLEKWEVWEEKDMPGISLGFLFNCREITEKEIENLTNVKMPYTYDDQRSAHRLDEVWINIFYLFSLVHAKPLSKISDAVTDEQKIKWKEVLSEIAFHAYYVTVKEMKNKYEQVCINLDELPPSAGTGIYGR